MKFHLFAQNCPAGDEIASPAVQLSRSGNVQESMNRSSLAEIGRKWSKAQAESFAHSHTE